MSAAFDRRELLRRTAVAGAAVAAPGWLSPADVSAAGQFRGRIKKAVKLSMVTEPKTLEGKFQMVKDLGFEGVEAHTRANYDRDELKRASESSGVPIHGILNSTNPDIRSAIELAKFVGATSVLCVAGKVDAKTPYDENYRQTQKFIRDALPLAEKHEVRLLVENVWNDFLLSPLEMARYIDEFDSPWVGAYFDVGNVVRLGWPEQWIRLLGKRIGKVDIKEYRRQDRRDGGNWNGFDTPLGEGDIDWAAVRKELDAIGYRGWATAEIRGGDRQRLADIAARMDRVLDLV